jgi:Flp pilus assembly protein CpaB
VVETVLAAADRARPPHVADLEGGRPPRLIRRRRALPSGRAALGALLVAVAAVGTFAAASGATADPRRPYVVARTDLAVGHRIERSDLAVGRMQLPGFVQAFRPVDASRLLGTVVVGAVARGGLLQRADVRGRSPLGPEVSFAIDPARAVGGDLQPGELVDILATADASPTTVVVRAARVVSARSKGGLAGGDSLVVTVDVPTADAAVALAHAVDAGHITVVRRAP